MENNYWLNVLIYGSILGFIPAMIIRSKSKKESFFGWWIYGALLFIIALPHALLFKPKKDDIEEQKTDDGMKKCPFCVEWIQGEARVCRYCGREMPS